MECFTRISHVHLVKPPLEKVWKGQANVKKKKEKDKSCVTFQRVQSDFFTTSRVSW